MQATERATERVTVLMTPSEKAALEHKAGVAGVTVSDLIRRSVDGFDPEAAEEMRLLADLGAALQRSNDQAARSLDEAVCELSAVVAALRTRRTA